ncbi:MAG: FtsQ-type POTRA domain-containing protein [Candidatus Pacebacteria bacterium]|nr:FtsQ-type POTRA domain-containing protein [Candidatus Paceibacterota bacterium]
MNRKSRSFKKNKNGSAKSFKRGLLVTLVLIVAYFIFFSEFFIIKKIEIEGNKTISNESIEKIIKNENSNSALVIFTKNNFFLSDKEEIKKKIIDEFSEIKTITIKKKLPDTIKVKIIEEIPLVLWCRIENCYYLNNKGIAFMAENNDAGIYKNKKFIKIIEETEIKEEIIENTNENKEIKEDIKTEIKYFKDKDGKWEIKKEGDGREYYEKETGNNEIERIYLAEQEIELKEKAALIPIKINDEVANKNFIDFILELDNSIKKNTTLKIKYYKTKGIKTRELIAYTDRNIRIYFNATNDAKLQTTYLKDFISKGIGKKEINALEYIYLESGNKIFYK